MEATASSSADAAGAGQMRKQWCSMNDLRSWNLAMQVLEWRQSNRLFLATFAGTLAVVYTFILLIDPYGVMPYSPLFGRPIVGSTMRQIYPQILRNGRYDSIVVGTSTARLLDPAALGVLGGHFANLGMPGATAREQAQIIDLFLRRVATPRALLVGLDHEWCGRNRASIEREKPFPSWAFDDNPWNDLLYLLNTPTLEAANNALGGVLGRTFAQIRDDGFEDFMPPESTYDPARARDHLYRPQPAVLPPLRMSEAERDAMMSEALQLLDDSLAAVPVATRKILVFLPPHVNALPAPGSLGAIREDECKRRVAAIARRHGAMLVDWRIVSPLTTEDSHFWDPLHYRLPVAYGLIDDLGHAINEGRESPDGSYRILVR
jgi:hypothetical protein